MKRALLLAVIIAGCSPASSQTEPVSVIPHHPFPVIAKGSNGIVAGIPLAEIWDSDEQPWPESSMEHKSPYVSEGETLAVQLDDGPASDHDRKVLVYMTSGIYEGRIYLIERRFVKSTQAEPRTIAH